MKKYTYLSIFGVFFTFSLMAQTDFAPLGAKWVYNHFSIGYYNYDELTAEKDTLVDNQLYKKLLALGGHYGGANIYYLIRMEGSKLYHRVEGEEYLLFDFNAQVGDSLVIKLLTNNYTRVRCEGLLIIDSIGQVEIDGQQLKAFYPRLLYSDSLCMLQPYDAWEVPSIVERLGFLDFFFPQFCFKFCPYNRLHCYSDSTLHYKNLSIPVDCYFVTNTINIPAPIVLTLFPNPAADLLQIDYPQQENAAYEILSISGQRLKSGILYPGIQEVDVSSMPTGVHLFQARLDNDVFTQKIFIQN